MLWGFFSLGGKVVGTLFDTQLITKGYESTEIDDDLSAVMPSCGPPLNLFVCVVLIL